MAVFDIDGNIIDSAKEVWVDDYDSVTEALEDGDIINFTTGKLYEINDKITINKSCYIKGNGCFIHSDPREADPSNPRQMVNGEPTQLYVFDITHDNVIIENFNAYSEATANWENGGEIFPTTYSSNVYLVRISASNVTVRGISANQLSGAVRIADETNNQAFSYHDVNVDDITCLEGVINVYVGNVVRCTLSNLMLSNSQDMDDSHGHCIYLGRAIKHIALSNFTIYHNGGLLGGLSVHPSSTQDKSLCEFIAISNGVIYSSMSGTYAIQVTWARNIFFDNVIVDASNAASVYISGEVNNIEFSNCSLSGKSEVIRNNYQDYSGGQREILYNNCYIKSEGKDQSFIVARGIEGTIFKSCEFFIANYGSYTEPQCTLFSTKPVSVSKNFHVIIDGCYIRTLSDVVMHLFSQENTVESEVIINNTTVHSSASVSALLADNMTLYSILRIHNLTGVNYTSLCDATTWNNNLSKLYIDNKDTFDSSRLKNVILGNATKSFKINGETPNMIVMCKTTGQCAVATVMYSISNVNYITSQISDVTITKSANSDIITIANNASGSMFVAIL